MSKCIWLVFFSGWKTGKLARMSALCSQLLIVLFQLGIAALSARIVNASATGMLQGWLALGLLVVLALFLLTSVYCSILIMTKRMRDLGFKYPVCLTILTYISNFCAFWTMSALSELLMQDNHINILLCAVYTIIIFWNLYLISGKSRPTTC